MKYKELSISSDWQHATNKSLQKHGFCTVWKIVLKGCLSLKKSSSLFIGKVQKQTAMEGNHESTIKIAVFFKELKFCMIYSVVFQVFNDLFPSQS